MIWSRTILDGMIMCVIYPLYIGLIAYAILSAYLAGEWLKKSKSI